MADKKKFTPPYTNPSALGLTGFGISTTFLMLHNVGLIPLDSSILSNAILFGGLAQVIAGIMEFKRKNTFGLLVFTAYGFFWISFGLLLLFPMFYSQDSITSASPLAMGFYCLIWGLFTLGMTIWVFVNEPFIHLLQVIFVFLLVAFIGLAIVDWLKAAGANEVAKVLLFAVGVEGIILGLMAFLLAGIQLINDTYGKEYIPVYCKCVDLNKLTNKNKKKEVEVEKKDEEVVGEIELPEDLGEIDVDTEEAMGELNAEEEERLLEGIEV